MLYCVSTHYIINECCVKYLDSYVYSLKHNSWDISMLFNVVREPIPRVLYEPPQT